MVECHPPCWTRNDRMPLSYQSSMMIITVSCLDACFRKWHMNYFISEDLWPKQSESKIATDLWIISNSSHNNNRMKSFSVIKPTSTIYSSPSRLDLWSAILSCLKQELSWNAMKSLPSHSTKSPSWIQQQANWTSQIQYCLSCSRYYFEMQWKIVIVQIVHVHYNDN
jgi:hypothetical protein